MEKDRRPGRVSFPAQSPRPHKLPTPPNIMNVKSILTALLVASPLVAAKVYFKETFNDDSWESRWVQSKAKPDYGIMKVTPGNFYADKVESRGLQTTQDAKFYSISAPLDEPFDNKGKDLVLQFTVKFEQNIDCGGGYIKLLPRMNPKTFNGDTEYSIMFGPDICGYEKKIHAIITYKGKNHLINKKIDPGSDQLTHQYTFIIHPDQTYEILLDNKEESKGSILDDWDVLPPKTIKDPKATKPLDWVDEEHIPDPEDKKPDDWDDVPEFIVDEEAKKPDDWDEEADGEWEPPKIKNPEHRGNWAPMLIPNPAYKGPWVAPDIPNPEYVEDKNVYRLKNAHVGFDLWQVKSGTIFDNIIVTDSVEEAKAFSKETYEKLKDAEKAAKDKLDEDEKKAAAEEEAKKKKEEEKKELKKKEEKQPELEEVDADEDEEEEKKEEKKEDHDEFPMKNMTNSSGHAHHMYPAFTPTRPASGMSSKGFGSGGGSSPAGAGHHRNGGLTSSGVHPPLGGGKGANAMGSVAEEYIRNLQQQVYLLELETRYLRNPANSAGDSGGAGHHAGGSSSDFASGSSAPLNDAIRGLKHKYIELQANHKKEMQKMEDKMEQMITENQILSLSVQNLEKEREELRDEIKGMKEHHATEKDRIYGELIATRKKAEVALSDQQRLEKSNNRLHSEKQHLNTACAHANEDAKKYREQVEELLHINATLKVRVEELHKQNSSLQSRLEDHETSPTLYELQSTKSRMEELQRINVQLETEIQQAETKAKQEEHLRLRISQDCAELVKANVTLKNELEDVQRRLRKEFEAREQKVQRKSEQLKEAEELRDEFIRLKDEFSLQKIALDNKDRKIQDLKAQIQSMENALNSALETRNVVEERMAELEARTRAQENELIQLGQDKSLLVDDVAELRNSGELRSNKIQMLIKENQELQVQVDKFMREMSARKEFSSLIGQIESSGENYLHLMRNMRSYLHRPQDRTDSNREVEEIADGIPVNDRHERHH
ncbi:hypothetical protein HDV05_001642 [Chytridiales sp. JEL 0842]|nr:hypothetical protein HDV05_001642 [Chytridiales sp. JEL 0842]